MKLDSFVAVLVAILLAALFVGAAIGQDEINAIDPHGVTLPTTPTEVAQQVAQNTVAIALINKLDSIILALGTFIAALGGFIVALITAKRQAKLQQAQVEADRQRIQVIEQLNQVKASTNGLSDAAQAAAYERGLSLGAQKERDRIALEQASLQRGVEIGRTQALAPLVVPTPAVLPPAVVVPVVTPLKPGETPKRRKDDQVPGDQL